MSVDVNFIAICDSLMLLEEIQGVSEEGSAARKHDRIGEESVK